ncbi:exodeoxyribonuclease V subunit gamma [Pseudoxanthomonas mexicana]|uniref:exodeoxyribonuclease V subunit gamma n=1 Tax=Pseudoxanthomonas mexicana TaxID=128785 RepID=UPI00398A84E5
MTVAADFRLYHSNSLEILAGLLAEALREPAPGQPLLAPDTVLIPQVAMRRWLQATLAARHGVAANLEFLTPGEFVARALQANPDPGQAPPAAGDELDDAALRWHLYAALTDEGWMAQPALAALAAHVAGPDPLRPWALAGELAAVFEKYQAWRRDWLLRWEAGADPDDPQALLWRRVARGRRHRARRIQHYLDRFEAPGAPPPAGLPARLFAFATLNVSPDVLRVLATQARAGTLHFYVPSPAKDYWGDLQRARAGAAVEDAAENPLLRAWGAAGRDFMAVLGGYEVVHPSGEIPAHADPAARADAWRDGLLQRLQADLFHRRASPGAPPREAIDRGDPSLQVHACHTRLRELQVLHDQLRALFDDPRFDPPLQPREVAVLAPDIDPYIPYLDAVFGGHGQDDAIPYALADASPLAGEPLAEVFLRLLALPVSRFGLGETLDLLASPPLAEAADLDAAAFARLQAWLAAAGARWGLDATHRARLEAPADDAYTWQFALDRLLLGHASGSDALIEGAASSVAPMPELEGSALDALDTLIRLLRVLARHAVLLGEAMPPEAWRERLLGLLDALLPRMPAQASAQRALDRLRGLVDAFAADARRAGFEAAVPAEAVRAHFAAALGEADTRAPLLTGGVSIGRMVPMRLLPFRVICLLGMDDGDFPRRDPAAGLNRLTAELGGARRRPGDRSTRDDDRFLFLQLFAAAQDVFYLSYQGADPRDGSAREPSPLVSDLLAVAAAQHAPAADAARALVVHHPLQPFAPAAFGAGDEPRRFSYRQSWWKAAAGARRRGPLPRWFDGATMAMPMGEPEARLPVDALKRFLAAPAQAFLQQKLGLRLAEVERAGDDIEPLLAPAAGLEKHALQQAVFAAALRGDSDAAAHAALRARGLLPSGPLGRRALSAVRAEVDAYARAFLAWRGDALAGALQAEVDIDGTVLHGRLAEAYPHGLARLRFGKPNGASAIRDGIDWLLASAAGLALPLVQFHDAGRDGVGPHLRAALDPQQARAALAHLRVLRAYGLREPLPFAPYSSWAFFDAADYEQGLKAAESKWRGSAQGFAEGESEALRVALRGRDPFSDGDTRLQFADTALSVFLAVTRGVVHAGVDAEAIGAFESDFDAEAAP